MKEATDIFCAFIQKTIKHLQKKKRLSNFSSKRIETWIEDEDIPSPQELKDIITLLQEEKSPLFKEFKTLENEPLMHISERFYYFFKRGKIKNKYARTLKEYLSFSH